VSLSRQLLLSLGVVALMLAVSAWAYGRLPAQVAIHFGADGQANGWASPLKAVLILPGTVLSLSLLFAGLYLLPPGVGPRRSPRAFSAVWTALLLVLAGLHGVVIARALDAQLPVRNLVLILSSVLFLVLGNFAGKIRPNRVFGVRTPWTRADARVWDKTHRLFGWLMVLAGAVLFVGAITLRETPVLNGVFLAAALTPALVATIYSWWISGGGRSRPSGPARGRG
jgi:uncharacterized membrane protein